MDRIDDIIQTIDNVTYKIMMNLADKTDRVSYISLNGWCAIYGITAKQFIDWYNG